MTDDRDTTAAKLEELMVMYASSVASNEAEIETYIEALAISATAFQTSEKKLGLANLRLSVARTLLARLKMSAEDELAKSIRDASAKPPTAKSGKRGQTSSSGARKKARGEGR